MSEPNDHKDTSPTTEEMLLALLARVGMIEANVQAMVFVLFEHFSVTNGRSFEAFAERFGELRGVMMRGQLESLCQQFPNFEKLLRDHLLVAAGDQVEGLTEWRHFIDVEKK
jgi:hypothetical protein